MGMKLFFRTRIKEPGERVAWLTSGDGGRSSNSTDLDYFRAGHWCCADTRQNNDQVVLPASVTTLCSFNPVVIECYPIQPPNAKAYHIIKLPAIMKAQYGTTIFNGRAFPAMSHIGKMNEKYLKYDSSGGPENRIIER